MTRRADLLQLEQIAGGDPSRQRFLTELTLDPPDATSDQAGGPLLDEDYLILSTIHSAKGQEWKSVFVLDVVDGRIPSDLSAGTTAEIEEERRLLYVAMTRAKDDLHLRRAATVLHAPAECAGRPTCLCVADAVRAKQHPPPLHGHDLARFSGRANHDAAGRPRHRRGCGGTHARHVAIGHAFYASPYIVTDRVSFRDRCYFRCGADDGADGLSSMPNRSASSSVFTSFADALLSPSKSSCYARPDVMLPGSPASCPKFLPCNMPRNDAGAFSRPSTISSRYLSTTGRTHSPTSRRKSPLWLRNRRR